MNSRVDRRTFLTNAALAACGLGTRRLLSQQPAASTNLRTPSGPLRGELADGVRTFRGIPFAQPPIGNLRFRPPVKVAPWTTERDATRYAPAAMQPGEPNAQKSEDCLYLNVWAPESKGPHPVFFWIHGGGFTGGTSYIDGAKFARDGIVVVSVPYRLGVLGFLDLSPLLGKSFAGSANNGLLDLICCLEWVQGNIGAFGGDPTRVTIGGESAGAKLACILLGTPRAEPLFRQVISESGGAERIFAQPVSTSVAKAFGTQWRTEPGNTEANLASAPAAQLIGRQDSFLKDYPLHFPLRAEVDGHLLPRPPVQTIARGSGRGKRLLIGTNHDESASFLGPHPPSNPVAANLGNLTLAKFNSVFPRYKALYPNLTDEQLRIRAVTAEEYWVPSTRVADAHVRGGGTAFMYRLDFTETSGRLMNYAYHGLDLALVFDSPHPTVANVQAEATLAHPVHMAWVAFIQGKAPNATGLPSWPEYHPGTRLTMALNTESNVEDNPNDAELHLWDGLL